MISTLGASFGARLGVLESRSSYEAASAVHNRNEIAGRRIVTDHDVPVAGWRVQNLFARREAAAHFARLVPHKLSKKQEFDLRTVR